MTLVADYPTAAVCRTLDVPRGSFFYRRSQAAEDLSLREALLRLAGEWPTYGYRRLAVMLRREGFGVNGKRVRRLMHEMAIVGMLPARR